MQIALPFDWPAAEDARDFIVSEANRLAVRHLERPALWPVQATLLVGPRKSGRSLLGRIFAGRGRATLIDGVEDKPEEALFHAWNAAQAERRPLLMIADQPPPGWAVRLPDLRSRLAATPVATIGPPDDALIRALIEKLLVRRGLAVPRAVLTYMSRRVERSYVGIHRAVDALDEAALGKRSGLSVARAREALARLHVIDESQAIG